MAVEHTDAKAGSVLEEDGEQLPGMAPTFTCCPYPPFLQAVRQAVGGIQSPGCLQPRGVSGNQAPAPFPRQMLQYPGVRNAAEVLRRDTCGSPRSWQGAGVAHSHAQCFLLCTPTLPKQGRADHHHQNPGRVELLASRPVQDKWWLLPSNGYTALRLFRGDAFGGWQMDVKQAGTAGTSPVVSRKPDCPENMARLWAELLGTADRGSCRSKAVGSWRGPCEPHGPSQPRAPVPKGLL